MEVLKVADLSDSYGSLKRKLKIIKMRETVLPRLKRRGLKKDGF